MTLGLYPLCLFRLFHYYGASPTEHEGDSNDPT